MIKFKKIIKCLSFNIPQFKECLKEEHIILNDESSQPSTSDINPPPAVIQNGKSTHAFKSSIIEDMDLYHDTSIAMDFQPPSEIIHVPIDFPKVI